MYMPKIQTNEVRTMNNEYPLKKYDKMNSLCLIIGFSISLIDLIISFIIPINLENAKILIEIFIPALICMGLFTYSKIKYRSNEKQKGKV